MKRFMRLTTAATLAATPALADMHMSGGGTGGSGLTGADSIADMIRSSEIVGGDVYAIDRNYTDDAWSGEVFDTIDSNWQDIGTITDIVFSADGRTAGLVVSSGGLLDIGDYTVVLGMNDVRRVDMSDGEIDYVVRMTVDQLNELPQVAENWY